MRNKSKTITTQAHRTLGLALIGLTLGLHGVVWADNAEPAASLEARFDAAIEAYRAGRYPTAYGQMIRLAGEGHGEAARMALLMHRLGARLYGSQWDATPDQIQRWIVLATQAMQQQERMDGK